MQVDHSPQAQSTPPTLRRLTPADAHWWNAGFNVALRALVSEGSTLGFLAPFEEAAANLYWETLQPSLAGPARFWIAERGGRLVGFAGLSLCEGAQARHRAHLSMIAVVPDCRLHGIGRALLDRLERHALEAGRPLLVVDVPTDSPADAWFMRHGWQHGGQIPGYTTATDGRRQSSSRRYKVLPGPAFA